MVSVPVVAGFIGASAGASAANDSAATAMRGARVHNVREYGAKGDGSTLDTVAIQAAIDAAHGDIGGIVLVPAGDFVSGTLELKSNVTLHLAAQGRILGSSEIAHYRAGNGIPRGNG